MIVETLPACLCSGTHNAVLTGESRVVELPATALMAASSRIGWKRALKLIRPSRDAMATLHVLTAPG